MPLGSGLCITSVLGLLILPRKESGVGLCSESLHQPSEPHSRSGRLAVFHPLTQNWAQRAGLRVVRSVGGEGHRALLD